MNERPSRRTRYDDDSRLGDSMAIETLFKRGA